jgi:hypothetical protein
MSKRANTPTFTEAAEAVLVPCRQQSVADLRRPRLGFSLAERCAR